MEVLRDIAKLSSYRPNNGLKSELFILSQKQNLGRADAIEYFGKQGKKGQFLVVYKRLKDALLNGITDNSLKNLSPDSQARFRIWKKHLQTKILSSSRKENSWYKTSYRNDYFS